MIRIPLVNAHSLGATVAAIVGCCIARVEPAAGLGVVIFAVGWLLYCAVLMVAAAATAEAADR